MRISFASDLHIPRNLTEDYKPLSLTLRNEEKSDLLILAGDIAEFCIIRKTLEGWSDREELVYADTVKALRQINDAYPETLWVPGNHEYYMDDMTQQNFEATKAALLDLGLTKIKLAEKHHEVYGDVNIIGAVLWTNFMNDPIMKFHAGRGMNDYKYIKIDGRRFTTDDSLEIHQEHLNWLTEKYDPSKKNVIFTHHQPHELSIDEMYRDDVLRGAYANDLSEFILNRGSALHYWIAGHTHNFARYEIGQTVVCANPRGYSDERTYRDFQVDWFDI